MVEFLFSDQQLSPSCSIELASCSWYHFHPLSLLHPKPQTKNLLFPALLSRLPLSMDALLPHPVNLYFILFVWPGLLALWLPFRRHNTAPVPPCGLLSWFWPWEVMWHRVLKQRLLARTAGVWIPALQGYVKDHITLSKLFTSLTFSFLPLKDYCEI